MMRLAVVAALVLLPSIAAAAPGAPMEKIGSCVITVTNTATSLAALVETAGCKKLPSEAVLLWNNSTTVVCIGGSDVNTTVTAGGKCWPVCTTAASCKYDVYTARASPAAVYLKVASSTQAVLVHAGGPL